MATWTRGSLLGKGGFGFVSIGNSNSNDLGFDLPSTFAVKSAMVAQSGPLVEEKELLQRFQACPSVLRYYGDDTTTENGEQLYNIMLEYAAGGSLLDRVQSLRKGLTESTVSQFTRSILVALKHIHKEGYVHRDIKPHNILLVAAASNPSRKGEEGETAKLADFGLVKKVGSKSENQESNRGFRGTPIYAAPESISRKEYGQQSDIWALGCTVLYMITGKAPWNTDKDTKASDVLYRIGFSEKLPEIPKKVSSNAADFLKKCLVKDPHSRWTADMLLDHPFVLACEDAAGSKKHNMEKGTLLSKLRQQKKALAHSLHQSLHLPWFSHRKVHVRPMRA